MKTQRRARRGFTLTEILVALAIFALGGTAIMALFITNVRLSRDAMNYTRAAEITRNARSLMTQAVSRPIPYGESENLYAFYYPGTSLEFRPDHYIRDIESRETASVPNEAAIGGDALSNTLFFRLPTLAFIAGGDMTGDQMVTDLPGDARTSSGAPRTWAQGGNPRVFRFKPDRLRMAGATDGLDEDDRMSYQFDLQIRRSVLRSGVEEATGRGGKQPMDDLFVVHIRVYRGFEFDGDVITDPFFEWDFYVTATR